MQADENQSANTISSDNNAPVLRKKKSRIGMWIALVLLLLIAAVAAFLWQQYKVIHNLQTAFAEQVVNSEAERKALNNKIAETTAAQSKQYQNDIAELTQRLDNTASRVLALTAISHDDWKFTEVDYLLRMANQRILLEHEAADALALAQSANGILAELGSADLFPVRKKLSEEIESLKLVNKVDREGIYLQLLALTQQIENLPLIEPLIAEDEEEYMPDQTEGTASSGFWQGVGNFGKRAWHKLSSYVRVRDQGRRVDAILPPEDQMYLKQNLRLMLEQAQIGLLREEQHVYQASLDKAQNWIRDYYPLNEQAEIVLNDLEQLKKNNVEHSLPDFSGSAALIKEYIHQKDRLAFSRRGGN
jgi:uroporphyrin-3 C-methyltransferase